MTAMKNAASRLTAGVLALGASLVWGSDCFAAYPDHPVKIIVPFTAGGPSDFVARLLADKLSASLKQQFFVENRTGAGGNIATEAAVRAPADGYTLLMVNASHAINATLYDKLNFNVIRDVAPVPLSESVHTA